MLSPSICIYINSYCCCVLFGTKFLRYINKIYWTFRVLWLFFALFIFLRNMVSLVSRTGRHLQRYNKGRRLVVGCIPYRYKAGMDGKTNDELEVLVISSQKGQEMMFPKGGWELDESLKEAARRESLEEAGVLGNIENELGKWRFKSKSHGIYHEGYMFPLFVTEQLDLWPEHNVRRRAWMSVGDAREVCKHWWMKEALDRLVDRLIISGELLEEEEHLTDNHLVS